MNGAAVNGAGATRAAVLCGIGCALPPRTVTNDMLSERLDTSDEWIRTRTGIRERRFAEPGTATGDLAAEAGAQALESAGHGSVDLLILATSTPDHPLPGTAPSVAHRLGLGHIPAFDVAAVCSGFVYALSIAANAIAAGAAGRVLVIGADTYSSILSPTDRGTAVVFGDGAGAAVLRAGEPDEPGALLGFELGSDGSGAELIMVPGGGSRQRSGAGVAPDPETAWFTMQGREVFVQAADRMEGATRSLLKRIGWSVGSVDRIVAHQANLRILHAIAERLELPYERAVVHLDRVGNTSAASIPLALADAARGGGLEPGQRVVLTAFGGGLTWGSAALVWPDVRLPRSLDAPARTDREAASKEGGAAVAVPKITEYVISVLVNKYGYRESDIDLEADLAELAFDSLVLTELSGLLSRAFGVQITHDELADAHSVAAIVALVDAHVRTDVAA